MDSEANALPYKRARFATQLPMAHLYSPGHHWIGQTDEQTWRVGLTKFGSRMLGEMVDYGFEAGLGTAVTPGQVIGWIEGFKALSELVCVVAGEFVGPNPALEQNIILINRDPYGDGWLYAVRGNPDPTCMDVHAYAQLLDRTIDQLLQKG
jgi:glycine cleavage system H protein